jgi:dolichol-phosphate mannosyltransferase
MLATAAPGEPSAAADVPVDAAVRTPSVRTAPLLFVVPAFNEEENLPRLIRDLEARPLLFPSGSRLIVVDDGSEDGTAALIESYRGPLPVELVRLGRNQGPGAAFRAGFAAALDGAPDQAMVVTIEADTTSDLDVLPLMLSRADAGAELVLASVHGGGQMIAVSRHRRLLSAGAGYVVRRALGLDARTVSSFFRVYRVTLLRRGLSRYGDAMITESGFACKAELLAKLAALGARIEEVPVDLDASRRIGESRMPVMGTMLGYWRLMTRMRLERESSAA